MIALFECGFLIDVPPHLTILTATQSLLTARSWKLRSACAVAFLLAPGWWRRDRSETLADNVGTSSRHGEPSVELTTGSEQ